MNPAISTLCDAPAGLVDDSSPRRKSLPKKRSRSLKRLDLLARPRSTAMEKMTMNIVL